MNGHLGALFNIVLLRKIMLTLQPSKVLSGRSNDLKPEPYPQKRRADIGMQKLMLIPQLSLHV